MLQHNNTPPNADTLPRLDTGETVIDQVYALDPELAHSPETRMLVELGSEYCQQVTADFGTPTAPRWATGSYEREVFMSYHNGGVDGHTSVGEQGAGVPRNALLIAQRVNNIAGRTVFDPTMRATAFYAGAGHDGRQLCGRTLMSEGRGENRGDERLSAQEARDKYIAAGGDPDIATDAYYGVMATAFNPQTGAQNVDRSTAGADTTRRILLQELVAAADLLGPTTSRGPLGALEYTLESLTMRQKNNVLTDRLRERDIDPTTITDIPTLLTFIEGDRELKHAFALGVAGQSAFFSDYLRFPDPAINEACGLGIDELFPGRVANAKTLADFAAALQNGSSIAHIWAQARSLAGHDL